ncbi:MAG: hypothetical protein H0U95_02525 [Bacteroidetes bacterium]|nr:hypothetical protein [Bacteroidota bacterium]
MLFGQTYPIQISTQLVPPYSGYLPDYADPSAEKLKVILQFNDFSVAQYNLKLKFEIKGNGFTLSTKTFYNPPPITLLPGQPLLLSSIDLAPYLNSNNLDFIGINQNQYEQRMALPEGYYSICVKAYDYYNNTNIQVSNESCTQAWFTLSDPPFLNLPICNSVITPQTPQNVLFQWTPINLGSPNSAMNTEYEFALWEVRPDSSANPNQIVLSAAPVFSKTTQQPFINYGITETPLNLYMKYVWRVKVKDITGRDWFKNSGYSQICTFTYGNLTNVIGNALNLTLNAQTISHRTGQCDWTMNSAFTNYLLQVRKQGTTAWFDYPNTIGIERVSNLEPNTTYQARVRGEGTNLTGNWSNTASFTTAGPPNFACNDQTMPNNTSPSQPLPLNKAVTGLVIQSGQFEIMTTQIEPSGPPGWYKGKGYALIFGALPVAVRWNNIFIDADNRQQQGVIEAMTNGIDKWMSQWDMAMAEQNATYVNGTIDSVFVNGNQVCYTLQGSTGPICVPTPTGTNMMVIRDGEGNQYSITFVPPPPKITGPSNYLNYSSDSLEAGENEIVFFTASAGQNYGFDKKEYAAFIKNYEAIKLRNGKNYFVPNKSIGLDQTDEVLAQLQITGYNANQLSFKTNGGTDLSFVSTNTANQVKITGIPANAISVYAWYNNKKIGKLNVVSLKAIAKKVVLVPVNNSNVSITANDLNSIFKQANVTWSVSTAPNFNFTLGSDGLEAADAKLMSKYSGEMRQLRDAYKQFDSLYDKNAYYVFVVPSFNNQELKGYMPRGRALGFISATAAGKELAHELCHGGFALEHTFPKIEKSSCNNLMDYTNGSQLIKEQWTSIQSEKFELNWRDDKEDAQYCVYQTAANVIIFETLKMIKKCYNAHVSMPMTQFSNGRTLGYQIKNTYVGGIQYDYIYIYKDLGTNLQKTTLNPYNNITSEEKSTIGLVGYGLIKIDNAMYVEVPANCRINMELYLKSPQDKNLILFVNGYRPNTPSLIEKPNSLNKIYSGDVNGYWAGIDGMFMNRIGTKNAIYADGHHSVATANHLSQANFLASMGSSMDPTALTVLNTIPNVSGYQVRYNYGKVAGYDLIAKLNNNTITFNKTTDTLDIVSHSMGYAYAVGIIDALNGSGVKFGRFYILAPENACTGTCDWTKFTETWQYGSNLNEKNADPIKEQDGVAPQCECTNLKSSNGQINSGNGKAIKTGRVFIPSDVKTKSFVGSHSIDNYGWIFSIISGDPKGGYVKPRN